MPIPQPLDDAAPTTAVRFADDADPRALAELLRAAFAEYDGRLDPPAGAFAETADSVADMLAAGEWCIVAGDAPDACLFVRRDAEAAYLHRLAVRPEVRGGGLATAMIRAAEARAADEGIRLLWLNVRLALTANQRLFESLGFRVTEGLSHPGYDRVTYLRMEKRVGSDG